MWKTILICVGLVGVLLLWDCSPQGGESADQRLEVEALSYEYRPAALSARPGTIRFVVTNTAAEVHGFEVEGHGMEEEIERIPPGASDSLTMTLTEPGEYEIYCPVDDHDQRGMKGKLTVEAGGEA